MRARLPITLARIPVLALLLAACLPGDTRPPPAVIHLTVEPSPAVTEGVTTEDGWHITFERFLIVLGSARFGALGDGEGRFDEEACTPYANANYTRLFDLTAGGRQPLSDIYGIGRCGVAFSLSAASRDSPLGAGVSAEDLAFMRTSIPDNFGTMSYRSTYVRGKATRDATTKRFEWSFAQFFSFQGCISADGFGFASDVILTSGAVVDLPVVVHGEVLFRAGFKDDSPLRFDDMAAADTNGDQMISLDELGAAPGPPIEIEEADAGLTPVDAGVPSIEDLLSRSRLFRMVRLRDSGPCLGVPP